MSTAQLSAPARTSAAPTTPLASAGWLVLGVIAALVAALFGSSFISLVGLWGRDANYSHGYLVAPISLILALRIYRRVGPPVGGEIAFGTLGILLRISFHSAAILFRWPPLSYLGLVCILRGAARLRPAGTLGRGFQLPTAVPVLHVPGPGHLDELRVPLAAGHRQPASARR